MLDIGCGPAITSILLYHACRLDMLYLMDGDGGERTHGYGEARNPWQDMRTTLTIAEANKVKYQIVHPSNGLTIPCDMIMSLLSWGHHYPVETYLGLAQRSLARGGRLIIDLRKETQGLEHLQGFAVLARLDGTTKLDRYVLERL